MVENQARPISYFNALTNSGMNVQKWNNVWSEKANHIKKKAFMALKDDHATMQQISSSCDSVAAKYKQNDKIQTTMMIVLAALFVAWIVLSIVFQALQTK